MKYECVHGPEFFKNTYTVHQPNLSVAFISKDKRQVNLVDAPCIIL